MKDRITFNDLPTEALESKNSPPTAHLRSINGQLLQAIDPVAEAMSKEQQDTPIITVYINGEPKTMPLVDLLPR